MKTVQFIIIYFVIDFISAAPKQLISWNANEKTLISKSMGIPKVMTPNNDTHKLKRNDRLVFEGPVYSPNTDKIYFPDDNIDANKVIDDNEKVYSTTVKSISTTKNIISTTEDNYITEINNSTEIDEDDDDEIDFSASFTPNTLIQPLNTNFQTTQPTVITSLYAICSAEHSIRASWHLGSNATSGTHTFPNGTKVQYAECRVVVITHP
ncbi:unnamed protein product [Chironomus riparius]|uniref:Uncharacterized protein n=1 Tax=Chironomus riparius TaxID=315576 RepID=A0A9N9RUC2_9DIPT|nr:unnamed protein product [Chironomus riparius]